MFYWWLICKSCYIFIGFCFWYCKRRRDNRNEEPPNCAYKLFCPPCAVFGYQGCESKMDICMSYICCCWFSVCCWSPKAVVVADNEPTIVNIQSGVNLEMPTATVVSNYDLEKL